MVPQIRHSAVLGICGGVDRVEDHLEGGGAYQRTLYYRHGFSSPISDVKMTDCHDGITTATDTPACP